MVRTSIIVIGVLGLAGMSGGCATTPSASNPVDVTVTRLGFDEVRPPARPMVAAPRPHSPAQAGAMISQVAARLSHGDREGALPLLLGLLQSDFLTDQGRANLYWLLAEAADGVDDARRQDALGGYIVAASVIAADADTALRVRQAKAGLVALKVKQRALGSRPELAIVVPSQTDADIVVAALDCGADGDGHYIERRLPGAFRGEALEPRRLLCTENGDELTLWFRVESP